MDLADDLSYRMNEYYFLLSLKRESKVEDTNLSTSKVGTRFRSVSQSGAQEGGRSERPGVLY